MCVSWSTRAVIDLEGWPRSGAVSYRLSTTGPFDDDLAEIAAGEHEVGDVVDVLGHEVAAIILGSMAEAARACAH
jgi:hypothetical protein